ncbi:Protein of unknown function [Gryllus bimaculatus]|nr:Protein of unknown function [Gryllus bimaculatus]
MVISRLSLLLNYQSSLRLRSEQTYFLQLSPQAFAASAKISYILLDNELILSPVQLGAGLQRHRTQLEHVTTCEYRSSVNCYCKLSIIQSLSTAFLQFHHFSIFPEKVRCLQPSCPVAPLQVTDAAAAAAVGAGWRSPAAAAATAPRTAAAAAAAAGAAAEGDGAAPTPEPLRQVPSPPPLAGPRARLFCTPNT